MVDRSPSYSISLGSDVTWQQASPDLRYGVAQGRVDFFTWSFLFIYLLFHLSKSLFTFTLSFPLLVFFLQLLQLNCFAQQTLLCYLIKFQYATRF